MEDIYFIMYYTQVANSMGYIEIKTSGCQSTINEQFRRQQSLGYHWQVKNSNLESTVDYLRRQYDDDLPYTKKEI